MAQLRRMSPADLIVSINTASAIELLYEFIGHKTPVFMTDKYAEINTLK